MTKPDDGTLASRSDNPTVEGRICATLDYGLTHRHAFSVYADPKANALYEWAYWTRVYDLAHDAAAAAWRRVDAHQHGGAA